MPTDTARLFVIINLIKDSVFNKYVAMFLSVSVEMRKPIVEAILKLKNFKSLIRSYFLIPRVYL